MGEVTFFSESSQEVVEDNKVWRILGEVNGDQSKHSFATPLNKGNNKITELRTILQRESQKS